ncbi:MAG: four helix bundle protein [Caldilineaceae bacterium]|nr:four helix bundle protein [Caldilineaceae bacterium]
MAKGDDIEARLVQFAVRIIKVCTALPKSPEGRHIRGQLVRSGTAPAPNYAEGRGAESTKDFIHKLKICLKELNEIRVWLLIVQESEMLPANLLTDIIRECNKLCRIISASIKTARSRISS